MKRTRTTHLILITRPSRTFHLVRPILLGRRITVRSVRCDPGGNESRAAYSLNWRL